jgi:hypothetical protein
MTDNTTLVLFLKTYNTIAAVVKQKRTRLDLILHVRDLQILNNR